MFTIHKLDDGIIKGWTNFNWPYFRSGTIFSSASGISLVLSVWQRWGQLSIITLDPQIPAGCMEIFVYSMNSRFLWFPRHNLYEATTTAHDRVVESRAGKVLHNMIILKRFSEIPFFLYNSLSRLKPLLVLVPQRTRYYLLLPCYHSINVNRVRVSGFPFQNIGGLQRSHRWSL